jgi:hypothetical protein
MDVEMKEWDAISTLSNAHIQLIVLGLRLNEFWFLP